MYVLKLFYFFFHYVLLLFYHFICYFNMFARQLLFILFLFLQVMAARSRLRGVIQPLIDEARREAHLIGSHPISSLPSLPLYFFLSFFSYLSPRPCMLLIYVLLDEQQHDMIHTLATAIDEAGNIIFSDDDVSFPTLIIFDLFFYSFCSRLSPSFF